MGTSLAGTTLAGMPPPGFVAPTAPPVPLPPPAPVAQAAPSKATEADEALASAYPSVALFGLIKDGSKPAQSPRGPAPVVSDTILPAQTGQAAVAPPPGQAAPAAAPQGVASATSPPPPPGQAPAAPPPATSSASDADDALASAYPSRSIFSVFRSSN